MTKRFGLLMAVTVLGFLLQGIAGCSDSEPPGKTTIEKLNSDNPEELKSGLEEANKKYGGNQ